LTIFDECNGWVGILMSTKALRSRASDNRPLIINRQVQMFLAEPQDGDQATE